MTVTSPETQSLFAEAVQRHTAGDFEVAVVLYRAVLQQAPDFADAHYNQAIAFQQMDRVAEAVVGYRRAIEIDPNFARAHHNLGIAYAGLQQWEAALDSHTAATQCSPAYKAPHHHRANALRHLGRLPEAADSLQRVIDLDPNDARAYLDLGIIQERQGKLHDAAISFRRAIELCPDYAEAHHNLGMVLLKQGNLPAGWDLHEWRWKTPKLIGAHRRFSQPQWRGEAAAGQTLLIHAEQGLGDTLHFCRYAPLAKARGFRVVMEVQPALTRLMRCLPRVDLVVTRGDPLPVFDLHAPMLSLPWAFGTTLETIPSHVPYLHADPSRWRRSLPATRPLVGLAWAGSPGLTADRRRSLPPDRLAPLLAIEGVQFVSLQKDGAAGMPMLDVMAEMQDFADTAALVAALDLVISVDTAVAHLAGALGKPVWLLDRFDHDWRWLEGRRDSPWYPTLRIYRQPTPGDWASVLAEIARDLRVRWAAPPGIESRRLPGQIAV